MRWLKLIAGPVCAVLVLVLTGCDQQRIEKLEEGVATEADVRQQFGQPLAVYNDPDGSLTLEYSRQPEGHTNYFITIGPDGKMSKLRQVLTPRNLAKVQPGMDKTEVRRLLGQPARVRTFALAKDEEHWEWRWLDGQQNKQFSVIFDAGGHALSSASTDDPREVPGGRN